MKLKDLNAEKLHKLISIGTQMSNLCYNLGQEDSSSQAWLRNRDVMLRLAKQWDEALRKDKSS